MSERLWDDVSQRVLAGYAHAANGRAGALHGIAMLAKSGAGPEDWAELLEHEAELLERFALGLTVLAEEGEPEPLDPGDVLAMASLVLQPLHVSMEPGPLADGVVVVRARRGALLRQLVALVLRLAGTRLRTPVGWQVSRAGQRVHITLRGEAPQAASALALTPDFELVDAGDVITVVLPALDTSPA